QCHSVSWTTKSYTHEVVRDPVNSTGGQLVCEVELWGGVIFRHTSGVPLHFARYRHPRIDPFTAHAAAWHIDLRHCGRGSAAPGFE
ncbi:unnamed protein product, partial [Pylaiella littoralis]